MLFEIGHDSQQDRRDFREVIRADAIVAKVDVVFDTGASGL